MEGLKVSIIVPVFNVDKYISKCVDSLINQTYKNIEIILVDDGSTDFSSKIIDDYAKKDQRIITIHKKNGGVSSARNIGLKNSTGEYICFADADDFLMPDYVEYLYILATQNNADISMSVDIFTSFYKKQNSDDFIDIKTPEDALIDLLTYKMPIGVYSKMFKKTLLENNICFYENIFIGEGFNFNAMAIQRANKIVEGHHKIYFYRRDNPTSATTVFSLKKWENGIFAINNIHDNFILHTKRIEKAWEYAFWHTHCDAFDFLIMSGEDKKYSDIYKKRKKIVKTKAITAFKVKISFKERIRAIIMFTFPRVMPFLISKRNEKYRKVENYE